MAFGFCFLPTGKFPQWLSTCMLLALALGCAYCLAEKQKQKLALQADGCSNPDLGIDISSLGFNNGTSRFMDQKDQNSFGIWLYSYNPCYPFNEGTCSGQAVCQKSASMNEYFQCGDAKSAKWAMSGGNPNNPVIVYTNQGTDLNRTSTIELKCNQTAVIPQLVTIGDISNGVYNFTLISKCACPHAC